jgi:hypothetical protein
MPRPSRPAAAAAWLLPALLALAACGGGTASGTPSPAVTASPTTAPATAPPETARPTDASPIPATASPSLGAASAAPPSASVAAIPTFDLGGLTDHLPDVDSYRTSFVVDGVEQYSSVVVSKPEIRRRVTFLDGGLSTTIVQVGDQSWVKSADQTAFQPIPAELSSAMLGAFDPAVILGAFAQIDWTRDALDQGPEEKNGVPSRHYRIDPTSAAGTLTVPPGSSIDAWIADDGYLVAWESTGFTGKQDISIEVTHVDDPANVVDAPS